MINKRPTTFSFITGKLLKEVRISVFRDLSYRLIAINEGGCRAHSTKGETIALNQNGRLTVLHPSISRYHCSLTWHVSGQDWDRTQNWPIYLHRGFRHSPCPVPRYIVLKGFETALETEKLICFVNLKGLNRRETEREAERGLADHAKMKR